MSEKPNQENAPEIDNVKLEELMPTIKTCQELLADGKNRDRLSDCGWPLYNAVRNKVGDKNNSLHLVPDDVWQTYEKEMKESGTEGY